jgi:hypothetical protein
MADYRCYCLDRFGCIRAVTALTADSDERARASAAVLLATCSHDLAEIWDGRRRVCTIDGRQPADIASRRRADRAERPYA